MRQDCLQKKYFQFSLGWRGVEGGGCLNTRNLALSDIWHQFGKKWEKFRQKNKIKSKIKTAYVLLEINFKRDQTIY